MGRRWTFCIFLNWANTKKEARKLVESSILFSSSLRKARTKDSSKERRRSAVLSAKKKLQRRPHIFVTSAQHIFWFLESISLTIHNIPSVGSMALLSQQHQSALCTEGPNFDLRGFKSINKNKCSKRPAGRQKATDYNTVNKFPSLLMVLFLTNPTIRWLKPLI